MTSGVKTEIGYISALLTVRVSKLSSCRKTRFSRSEGSNSNIRHMAKAAEMRFSLSIDTTTKEDAAQKISVLVRRLKHVVQMVPMTVSLDLTGNSRRRK